MSKYQQHGARTNTVGGKNVVLRQMTKHYRALADMKASIDTNEPTSRVRFNKVKKSIKSPNRKFKKKNNNKKISISSPLGYAKSPPPKTILQKTTNAIKRINTEIGPLNPNSDHSKCSSDLSQKFIQRRIRKEKLEMREHKKTLNKINNTIHRLDNQSVHDRKYNKFDPVAYPVTLFRRNNQNNKPVDCLSDSSKNLGRRKLLIDTKIKNELQYSYQKTVSNRSTPKGFNYLRTSEISSQANLGAPHSSRSCAAFSCPTSPNTKPKRPQSARNSNRKRNSRKRSTSNLNELQIDPEILQLKNQLMSEIIQFKIFAQDKLIIFFKQKLLQYGPNDKYLINVINQLCNEFHVPHQKVMVN